MTNVTSLLKTVKAVEDEATRGTRALEATIEFIKQELTVRHSGGVMECDSGDISRFQNHHVFIKTIRVFAFA